MENGTVDGRAVPPWMPVLLGLFAVAVPLVLLPSVPAETRAHASASAMVGAGFLATICCWMRASVLTGERRRPWSLLALAGAVALVGNLWTVVTGSVGVDDSNAVRNLAAGVGLLICVVALLSFVSFKGSRSERIVTALDGFAVGGSLLMIVSTLAFPELLMNAPRGDRMAQVTNLAFPVIDCVLATLAVLVVLRSPRTKRLALALVGASFLLYGVSDIVFAVTTIDGDYAYGGPIDLGWIWGYLLVAAAASTRIQPVDMSGHQEPALPATVVSTMVTGLTIAAIVVQALFHDSGTLARFDGLLVVMIIAAAGTRRVLLTIDNTELRRGLERQVEEQTADLLQMVRRHEALLSAVGEGIYGVDRDGRITFANPMVSRLLGYPVSELVGASAHDLLHRDEDGHELHPRRECSTYKTASRWLETTLEERYRCADGRTIPVESISAPLFDDELSGAVVVFRDIGQRLEVDRVKNEFLSVVSHELRTPLTAILGSLELISSGELGEVPARVGKLVDVASRSSLRLSRLIDDLLDVERIESGSETLIFTTTTASAVVTSAVQQVQGMARQNGVTLRCGFVDGVIKADEDKIVQTLINLLGNAVKFSAAGSEVVVESHAIDDRVLFQVHDQGRGIPEDKLELIFHRFQQVDSSDARNLGGTGLGLAISRSIVERHGGKIWATSEVGVGTTMTFRLPAVVEEPDVAPETGATVLLVEDDEDLAAVVSTTLAREGLYVVHARSVAQAVELASRVDPDVVILDVLLPDGDGAEVVEQLRRLGILDRAALVIHTGVAPPASGRPALGEDRYVQKSPTSIATLCEQVLGLVRLPAGQDA